MKTTRSVVVIHESPETRSVAMAFCDCLVQRFWATFDFDPAWWAFEALNDSGTARAAAAKAADAALVLFAVTPGRPLPAEVKSWVDLWLSQRGDREGLLIGLVGVEERPSPKAAEIHLYLRSVAHRAGMDYLTEVPENLAPPVPESPESCADRAREVTSLLHEILHKPPPPPPLMPV
jgi:hypothetical protein